MLATIPYIRERAVEYAERWALDRNPLFESYDGIGGDCTNFVSQCIYAGSCVMNYTPTFGWYYISPTNRAPAWTGVEFLYNFLTSNESVSVFGVEKEDGEIELGDIIQLGDQNGDFYHTLIVTSFSESGEYLVSAHSNDQLNRPLSAYSFYTARYIHILGVRLEIPDFFAPRCFRGLIEGREI